MDKQLEMGMLEILETMKKNSIQVSYQNNRKHLKGIYSKFGGRPYLPKDFVWPYYDGETYDEIKAIRPLSFLTQIKLSDVSELDSEGLLPKEGIISFFYEMDTQKWGFDPKDKGCSKVFYFEDETQLLETDFPIDLDEDFRFPEFRADFAKQISIPTYADFQNINEKNKSAAFSIDIDNFRWEDFDNLRRKLGAMDDEWGDFSCLLGYPDVIQNPMEEECEKVTRGYYQGDANTKISKELLAEIEVASKDWILLFQMGTIENKDFELMFGDCGHIYFWIRKQDLAARNFDNVWLILQCC